MHRSNTISGSTSGYSTLRKKGSGGPAPLPVGIPNPIKSPSKSSKSNDTYDMESHESLNSSSGNISNFSSMSSLSTASGDHIAIDQNQVQHQVAATYSDEVREQVAYYTQNNARTVITGNAEHIIT